MTINQRRRKIACIYLFLLQCSPIKGFSLLPTSRCVAVSPFVVQAGRKYGPPSSDDTFGSGHPFQRASCDSSLSPELVRQKTLALQSLIQKVREVTDPQHVPSLLTRHMELLLDFSPLEMAACLDSVRDAARVQGDDATAEEETEEVIDLILSFAQDFCDETAKVYDTNRRLLGRIMTAMSSKPTTAASDGRERREEALDDLFAEEKEKLTPGFLRHLAGECERIENAPKTTPESLRLLESLRIIQARVVDELGEDLGEPAQVIMQLLGYDTKGERIAVLEAGLVVRGVDFAKELLASTDEALRGFQNVPNGADPELVERVQEIHDRTVEYISDESDESFQ